MLLKKIVKSNKTLYNLARFVQYKLEIIRYYRIKYCYISYLRKQFKKHIGYELNLDKPCTFNEKIQWLKCYYRDPIMTQCADKFAVREIIAKIIGEDYLTHLYGVYDSVDDIELDKLPNSFVLKPTHSSGRVIICTDKSKMNWKDEFAKLRKWMKRNYYYQNGEWVYKDIKPKIVCEKYLTGDMIDYKFMCFYGEPKLMFTCSERNKGLKVTFFDLQFNKLPFIRKYPASDKVEKPKHFSDMIALSRKLAKEFPFVRVDFYENCGKIYFGELTFFPGNGMEWFEPIEWDKKIGDLLDLGKLNKAYIKR